MGEPSKAIRQKRQDVKEAFLFRDTRLAVVNAEIENLNGTIDSLYEEYDEHPWPSMRERIRGLEGELKSLENEKKSLENNVTDYTSQGPIYRATSPKFTRRNARNFSLN